LVSGQSSEAATKLLSDGDDMKFHPPAGQQPFGKIIAGKTIFTPSERIFFHTQGNDFAIHDFVKIL
jgi:hypothetical protein